MLGLLNRVNRIEGSGLLQAVVLFLFCFPLFFQLSGTIFTASDPIFDSQGSLLRLPLPIASLFCFVGIALFLRAEQNYFGMGFVFPLFMLMMLSAIVSTRHAEGSLELAKFIHLAQFILPSFALVLGSLYSRPVSMYLRVEAIALYVLAVIIPLEVAATISAGNVLAARLYFFSLYQHFQYLPVVFCGFYFLAVAAFYDKGHLRYLILVLAPFMGIYIAQSISVSTMLLAIYGSIVMLWLLYRKGAIRFVLTIIALALTAYLIYVPLVKDTKAYSSKFIDVEQSVIPGEITEEGEPAKSGQTYKGGDFFDKISQSLPKNLRPRLVYWHYYVSGILESPELLFFGHSTRPDRNKYPSAHNYYLDLVFNFGLIALLPFVYLIIFSIKGSWRGLKASNYSPDLAMLVAMVAFFVGVDNFFKVGFSQPYPGMMMYFLWGILLAKLNQTKSISGGNQEHVNGI